MKDKILESILSFYKLSLKEKNEHKKAHILRLGHGDDWGVLDWDNWETFSEEEKQYRLNLVLTL